MKSILHIGKFYPPFFGGIENFMAELLPACQQLGTKQSALVHNTELIRSVEEIDGVTIYRSARLGLLMFAPISPWFLSDLHSAMDEQTPDILHIHMPNLSAFWLLLSHKARKVPWIVHWHADVVGDRPKWFIKLFYPFYRVFERAILKRAKMVICTSPHYRDSSSPLLSYSDKLCVVPLGLHAVSPAENNSSVVCRAASPIIKVLVVGRLSYYKGHSVLFSALSELPVELRKKVEVKVVGIGELEQQLSDMLKSLELDNVTMLGQVSSEEINPLYDWCDLICLPSIERTEAFGLVILEAARQSKPALVTDVHGSGMSWVVEDKSTGWVVESNNADALSSQLTEIIQQPGQCITFGGLAYKRFAKKFSINSVAQEITDVYYSCSL
ncbi:glycosyltransferase [Shewanella sp. Scap07]|uniref:glycosyltransferase n=1 Tax=Shewanella sp. Scap07 TaxID=2589987 RepID=UPI0015B890E3|nr:glycosyltransferase [Shewanella sp. Scap07]QLE86067.1 glycosyltransferase [Shewanella sp. Scap07]